MDVRWIWESEAAMGGLAVLADAAVKGTVLLGLAWGVTAALRRASAAVRHWVWVAAMAGLVVLPAAGVVMPGWEVLPRFSIFDFRFSITGEGTPGAVAQNAPAPKDSPPVWHPADNPGLTVVGTDVEAAKDAGMLTPMPTPTPVTGGALPQPPSAAGPTAAVTSRMTLDAGWMLLGAWAMGVVVMVVPVGLGMLWLRRLRSQGVEVQEGEWRELMGRLGATAGVKRAVGLRRSKRCAVPLTFGVWRPVIVLPTEAMGWPAERRRMALLHELAHIRRGDCLTQMLLRCVRAVYWFHPLAWVAAARAQAECERACDDRVLTAGTRGSTYAEALMEYAAPLMRGRGGKVPPPPQGALAMARAATLEGRLLAILDAARNRRGVTWRAGVAVLALVAGIAAGLGMLRARGATSAPAVVATTRAAATQTAVDLETLVARCAPDRPPPAGMDGFEDLLKLRESRAPKAVVPLVKVLEAHLGSTRIHGFAAAQALHMIGGREAEAALAKHLLTEDRFPADMAYGYAFWWQMAEPQRSGFIDKYILQNRVTGLDAVLETKAGPGADEVTFGVTIKNTSAEPLDSLDDRGWVGDSLYLRAGERFADKDKRREDKRLPSWIRLEAGQERRFSAVGKVSGVEELRGKDRRVTAEVVQMLEVDGTFFYLPKGEVRGYAMVTMAGITEAQKKIAGGKADQAWAGRSVSKAVAVAMPGRAAAMEKNGAVFILGEVEKSGAYNCLKSGAGREGTGERRTIAEAVELAGITGEKASLGVMVLRRTEGVQEIRKTFRWADLRSGGTAAGERVQNGDVLIVAKLAALAPTKVEAVPNGPATFSVLGDRARMPGTYDMVDRPMTIFKGLALAGADMRDVATMKLMLCRNENGSMTVITLDPAGLMRGTAVDRSLQNGDVIFIGTRENEPVATTRAGGTAPKAATASAPAATTRAAMTREELLAAAEKLRAQFADLGKRYEALAKLIVPGMTKDDLVAVLPPTAMYGEAWNGNWAMGTYALEGGYGVEYRGYGSAASSFDRVLKVVLTASPRILSPEETKGKMPVITPAGAAAGATTRAAAPAPAGPLARIAEDLASTDYAVRAAARKRLDQVGAEQREMLERLAELVGDAEAKASLLARVDAIDAAALLNQPRITMSMQKESLENVATALTKATGIVFSVQPTIPATPAASPAVVPTVTLNAKDLPLWEVIRELSAQAPLRYRPSTSGVWLVPQGNGQAEPPPQVAGPLIFFPYQMGAAVARDPAGGIRLQGTAFADPRMDLVGQRLDFPWATDDKGNKLAVLGSSPGGFGGSGPVGPRDYARVNHFVWAVTVSPPADAAAKVNLKGMARLLLVDRFATKTVESPEKHIGEAMEVGGRTVTITQFDTAANGRLRCTVTVTPAPAGPLPAPPDASLAAGTAETADVRYTVLDATGQAMTNQTAPSPTNRLVPTGREPHRVVISVPMTWKAVTVPVELRDL